MFTTMIFIILCLCSLLLVKLQVPDASLVVFLVTELLAAMPNQNVANNAEVEVWFVQPELNSLEPNFFLIPTENGKRTENGQKRSSVESGPPTKNINPSREQIIKNFLVQAASMDVKLAITRRNIYFFVVIENKIK